MCHSEFPLIQVIQHQWNPRSLYCSTSLLVSTWSISIPLCIAYSIVHCFNLSLLTKDLRSVFQLPTWRNFYTGQMLWFLFFQITPGLWDWLLLRDGAHCWLTCGHQPQLVPLFHPSLSHTFLKLVSPIFFVATNSKLIHSFLKTWNTVTCPFTLNK